MERCRIDHQHDSFYSSLSCEHPVKCLIHPEFHAQNEYFIAQNGETGLWLDISK